MIEGNVLLEDDDKMLDGGARRRIRIARFELRVLDAPFANAKEPAFSVNAVALSSATSFLESFIVPNSLGFSGNKIAAPPFSELGCDTISRAVVIAVVNVSATLRFRFRRS